MQTLKLYVTPNQAQLQEISDLAESYNERPGHIPAISIQKKESEVHEFYDVFWLRDHYIEPHITEDINQILMLRAVVLTEKEFNNLFGE